MDVRLVGALPRGLCYPRLFNSWLKQIFPRGYPSLVSAAGLSIFTCWSSLSASLSSDIIADSGRDVQRTQW